MTTKVRKSSVYLVVAIFIVNYSAIAAKLEVLPTVGGGVTYTDNVNLSSSNKESGEVATFSGGVAVQATGNDGSLVLDYQANQTLHSYDSSRNELFNELALSVDKGLSRSGFRVDAAASVVNISRSVEDNANADFISGDTIESRKIETGVSYQSNPRGKVDLSARVNGSITSNEDNIGDFSSYGGNFSYKNGQAIKDYFWLIDYSYLKNSGKGNDTSNVAYKIREEFGLQQVNGFSPFIHLYYEDYEGGGEGDSTDSGSWGPGMRYYWHKRSYIELSYDFALDDDRDNFWRGAVHLNPTPRTQLHFNYTQRFYGDAYDFSLTHRNRRLTNTISYNEEPTSFDRRFFVEGDVIEELTLTRTLNWTSSLVLRRSTASLTLRGQDREAFSDLSQNTDDRTYGTAASISYRLSRRSSLLASFQFDYYEFDRQAQATQQDYYRTWDIGLNHSFTQDLSFSLNFKHTNKSSSERDNGYAENRANIDVRMQL